MHSIDMEQGWAAVPGATGILAKLLSGDFDEAAAKGYRTRMVRFVPGAETFEPFSHTYWEEVTLTEGSVTDKSDGTVYTAPCYVIRPPGTPHGPFVSDKGCVMVETQYFADRGVGLAEFLDQKAP